MSDYPKRIYLSCYPGEYVTDDDELIQNPTPYIENHEVTWCVDMIEGTDVEYIRKDLHDSRIEELEAQWVSVDERLPVALGEYEVVVQRSKYGSIERHQDIRDFDEWDGDRRFVQTNWETITHWKPKTPLPAQEEGSDE